MTITGLGSMKGRAALVTGAGQGLGRAIAAGLAHAGAKVAINDINESSAADTLALVESLGAEGVVVVADISDEASVQAMVGGVVAAFGSLDLAVNNAIPSIRLTPMISLDATYISALANVIVVGTALCLKHELLAMREAGGSIVNISSTASLRGQPGTGFYAGCKAAIEAMTRVAAGEHGGHGIRVNAVQAGGMLTPALKEVLERAPGALEAMERALPLGHVAEPEEIADAALFLLSDLGRYITGAVLAADGGGVLHAQNTVSE